MIERESLYWDEFKKRMVETISSLKRTQLPEVRRIAVFVTGQVVEYMKGKEISDKFKSLDPKLWVSYTLSRISKVERWRMVQDGI